MGDMTTTQVMAAWRAWQASEGLSERTITEGAATVTRLLNESGKGPLEIAPLDIIRFTGRPGVNANTRWTYHQRLRSYCRFLVAAEIRADDPSLKTPTPKRPPNNPRPISNPQLVQLLGAANRRRTRTMILLAAFAGLRVHEIAKIQGRDIDLEGRILTVTGKGSKTARLPLHEILVAEAGRYPRAAWWFPAYDAEPGDCPHVGAHAVSAAIGHAMRRAGFSATPHALRHWFATSLLEAGVDIRTLQKLMRHESIASTQIYTAVSGRRERDALNLLEMPVKEAS